MLKDIENLIFSEFVEIFTTPAPNDCECVSVNNLISLSQYPTNVLYGLSEKDIRNACRRLKAKGLIEHAWQHRNPDQPSGEYGEVWDNSPFVPRHGYAISEKGRQDEKLATDSRNLKNGLLGIERNGKKSYTCLCAGYATILQNICAMLDIKCNYISSSSKEVEDPNTFYFGEHKRVYENGTDDPKGHAYNSVILDGKQYLCDLTWDSYLLKVNGVLNYFLLSYDAFFESHKQSGFSENNVTVVNLDGKKSYSLNKEDFPESLPTEKLCSLLQIAYKEQLDEMQRIGYLGGFVSQYIDHLKENKSEIGLVDYYEIMKKVRTIEEFVLSDDFKRRGRLSALAIPIDIGNQQQNITFFNPNDSTVEETVESVERMVNHGR